MTGPGPRYRYYTATSLDGFLADEHDSLDWLLEQSGGDESIHPYEEFLAEVGAILTGRTTYDWVVAHEDLVAGAWVYTQPTFLFTHRPTAQQRAGVRAVSGPPGRHRAEIEEAAGGKDVWIVGGGDLAADCARAGMLDDLHVTIAPVTLGAGRPLLGGGFDLELRELGRSGAFLEAHYAMVGPRRTPAPGGGGRMAP